MISCIYEFDGEKVDISKIIGAVTINSSLDKLGVSCNFTIARNIYDKDFNNSENIEAGGIISIFKGTIRVFSGIIISLHKSKYSLEVKCLDFSLYLNKNKVIKQFKKLSVGNCIKQLCKSVDIKIGYMGELYTKITKIYKNKTVAFIIIDLLEQVKNETGKKYKAEIMGDTLNIILDGSVKSKINNLILGEVEQNESIENMKNSVLVTSNSQDETNILKLARDQVSIGKYGILQEIVEVDVANKVGQVNNIARNKLKELNKIQKSITFSVLGDIGFKTGNGIDVDFLGIDGNFIIKSVSHKFNMGTHISKIEVEKE